jgi:FAD-binding domain
MWIVDRLLRAICIVVFNSGYFGTRGHTCDASVEVLSPEVLRVTLRRPNHVYWKPGQYAYLRIPGLSTLGGHPFSISTVDVPHFRQQQLSAVSLDHDRSQEYKQLMFLVRVQKRLTQCVQRRDPIKILFDGPYGSPPLLIGFETVILIAGKHPLSGLNNEMTEGLARWIWGIIHTSLTTWPHPVRIVHHHGWIHGRLTFIPSIVVQRRERMYAGKSFSCGPC